MNKRIIWAAVIGLMVPYVGTLAWTGTIRGEELIYEQKKGVSGGRRILLDRSGGSYYMDPPRRCLTSTRRSAWCLPDATACPPQVLRERTIYTKDLTVSLF